jgi:DNA mismatch repair protein MSH4
MQSKYVSSPPNRRHSANTYLFSKANCNRLLDVARETYKENVSDIFQLNRTLSETHELPLAVVYQDSGFVFTLKKSDLDGELPKGFINVSMKKGKWFFSNMELVSTSDSSFSFWSCGLYVMSNAAFIL